MSRNTTCKPMPPAAGSLTGDTSGPCRRIHSTEPAAPCLCVHDPLAQVPDDAACTALWDRYDMPDHIRDHSSRVAAIATAMAEAARYAGIWPCVQTIRASALLHDLAKAYTIEHGGNHAQLGGAWTQSETGNVMVAMGVIHHVHWPWAIETVECFVPLAVAYADKRVRHREVVSVGDRYDDITERYGRSARIRERIGESKLRFLEIEAALSKTLGVSLDACTFVGRGLV